ncbi:MAG: WD40 repeat domain-containing protein [Anaerolineaceae bacterium]|nr:MAG: WD40 repeat domain-containing protein [Anaerolineaceae bacterium]
MIAITMLIASACTPLSDDQVAPSQAIQPTPQAIVPATYTAIAAQTMQAMLTQDTTTKPHDTSTPYPIPNGFDLSMPVYFLSHNQKGVWRLDPQAVELERASPREWEVTSFDVSPNDGRMAFGTKDGKVIVELMGTEPRTILDLREESEIPYHISSLAWSPGGDQLAYAVYLDWTLVGSDPEEERLSGIWVWDMEKEAHTHLFQNEYFPEDGDITQRAAYTQPVWSPDGTGMIVTGHFWEWFNVLWLDPIEPDLERLKLKNPLEWFWGDASWTLDGESILVSGLQYASVCDLYRVDRETLVPETLIDGDEEERFIFQAYELPEGIAFVSYDEEFEPRLYFGKPSDTGIQYGLVGSDALCTSVAVESVVWDQTGNYALVSCHHDRRLLSLDGSLDIDLDLYLGGMAKEEYIELFWGVGPEE